MTLLEAHVRIYQEAGRDLVSIKQKSDTVYFVEFTPSSNVPDYKGYWKYVLSTNSMEKYFVGETDKKDELIDGLEKLVTKYKSI